jgi:hypothetical protein
MTVAAPYDPFEPRSEPARSLYRAFQAEAMNRNARTLEEWIAGERAAVHQEAVEQAGKLGLRAPSPEEVAAAARYARGSIDYGAKWAHQVVAAMRRPGAAQLRG